MCVLCDGIHASMFFYGKVCVCACTRKCITCGKPKSSETFSYTISQRLSSMRQTYYVHVTMINCYEFIKEFHIATVNVRLGPLTEYKSHGTQTPTIFCCLHTKNCANTCTKTFTVLCRVTNYVSRINHTLVWVIPMNHPLVYSK